MRPAQIHTRIIQHPFLSLMEGGRLHSYHETGRELALDIDGLQLVSSELFERDGKVYELGEGKYVPLKVSFSNVSELRRDEFFTSLENIAEDDPSRVIGYMLSWRQPRKRDIFHIFGLRGAVGHMDFFARRVAHEKRDAQPGSVTFERDWSPAPPMPNRLVPQPNHLYRRFGGDPITIQTNGKVRHRQLLIGSLENQPYHRPQVDAVLNLGEEPSRWVEGQELHPNDRAINKGEGSHGMRVPEIREEAEWVIERLKDDQRVLVHCVAGMNRSTTICSAVLILLEGLSAEAALERVREHHPWARPDSYHWLALRWLEKTK